MTTKVLVLQKSGVSYVKLGSYSSFSSDYVINGEDAVAAPGDKSYAIVNGDVTRIERKTTPRRSIVGYALADRYKEITQLPHSKPVSAFTRDDEGDLCGENAEFYRPVYNEPIPYLEPIEFEIIDRDCEPVKIPSYVTIKFPDNIARYPETHHKYPCFIGAEQVFNMIWDRIKECVEASEGKYTIDNYKNIQALRVDERVAIPYLQTRTESYYPTTRARKTKERIVQIRWKTVKVIEIYGPKYSSSNVIARTPTIHGDNYLDLETKLETYIQSFLTQLTSGKREVCANCRGEGIVCP